MNDILPKEITAWHAIEAAFVRISERYNYQEVRTPILEPSALFVRSIGDATDIVEKEMYAFTDKGGDHLSVRPEGTASCVRAYVEHSVNAEEPISKWFYKGAMFRRERPARGRLRQFHQIGAELFGDPGPYSDAEMIAYAWDVLRELKIQNLTLLINTIGGPETKARYRETLVEYFTPFVTELSEDSQRRLETNPLRILDSKSPKDQGMVAGAPTLLSILSDADKTHFDTLLKLMDGLNIPYTVDHKLVRGLDYYSKTLFEIQGQGGELGAQAALCGGGRYDGLVKGMGGPDVPSIGFAMGVERLLLAQHVALDTEPQGAFIVVQHESLRAEAFRLLQSLRSAGIVADADLRGGNMKAQFKRADKSKSKWAIILGQDEMAKGVVSLRPMQSRGDDNTNNKAQEEVPIAQLLDRLQTLLS